MRIHTFNSPFLFVDIVVAVLICFPVVFEKVWVSVVIKKGCGIGIASFLIFAVAYLNLVQPENTAVIKKKY